MWRAVGERIIRDETVRDIALPLADYFAEFERKRCRNGNGARDSFVIVHHLGRDAGRGEDTADDIGGIVTADAAYDGIQIARLAVQVRFGKVG